MPSALASLGYEPFLDQSIQGAVQCVATHPAAVAHQRPGGTQGAVVAAVVLAVHIDQQLHLDRREFGPLRAFQHCVR